MYPNPCPPSNSKYVFPKPSYTLVISDFKASRPSMFQGDRFFFKRENKSRRGRSFFHARLLGRNRFQTVLVLSSLKRRVMMEDERKNKIRHTQIHVPVYKYNMYISFFFFFFKLQIFNETWDSADDTLMVALFHYKILVPSFFFIPFSLHFSRFPRHLLSLVIFLPVSFLPNPKKKQKRKEIKKTSISSSFHSNNNI